MHASISPDSRYVVSGGQDATLRLWDLTLNGEMVYCFHAYNGVYNVRFCGEDSKIIVALMDRHLNRKLMILRIQE